MSIIIDAISSAQAAVSDVSHPNYLPGKCFKKLSGIFYICQTVSGKGFGTYASAMPPMFPAPPPPLEEPPRLPTVHHRQQPIPAANSTEMQSHLQHLTLHLAKACLINLTEYSLCKTCQLILLF
jgi:hypothetical protein